MRPGIARIRGIFDYERVGGSPLLGVRGTVIITHGRARAADGRLRLRGRRDDRADRVPALIAEALAADAAPDAASRPRRRTRRRRAGGAIVTARS